MSFDAKILLSITTTPGSDWRQKIKEIDDLNLKEVALFPTFLEKKERDVLYNLLEKTNLETIPFTHLREEDMELAEIKYLTERWSCKVFNIHSGAVDVNKNVFGDYCDKIYVENGAALLEEKFVKASAGICLDFTHLENDRRLQPEIYDYIVNLTKKYKVGCAHIGAIMDKSFFREDVASYRYDKHFAEKESQFDYLKNYSLEMFPDYTALELENTLAEQLEFKNYIISLFN
ncbi:MAG: hypothetical protein COU29_03180 [Candidatus Magasanikbacteria bacterium CG10_big_fil_rev_8_21_14_0_10_36_32]|uniref:Xylose isomerase-like TIM barrel domain-containing protein n=1 Tax=Candidatus Magasanikbacteria bacterium CG10_big_fil_rev_8_21_14_0_10_36_32 TaxID=1974646 RepID=A0A2M6W615_9BACT|nr:MAG: hypothetical protein COU29_03180 [Candidatus Magasanikbacteria bacterium CG10_big_fil_rev_8_21_14_0_10_36_32]